jgi:Ran GTPase-activating protein (RanGAP) involved in mRNA processing and transport
MRSLLRHGRSVISILNFLFIFQEVVQFVSAISQNKAGGAKSRRVLVLGNYLFFTLREGGLGQKPKVAVVVYYVDLLHIETPPSSPDFVRIKYRRRMEESAEGSGGGGGGVDVMEFTCSKSAEMVEILRRSCDVICSGWPTDVKPFFPLDVSMLKNLPLSASSSGTQVADGLLEAYRAFCVSRCAAVSPEFLRYVEDVVALGCCELLLSDCPGVLTKSSISPDTLPIFDSLQFNPYFRSLCLYESTLRDVVSEIACSLIRHNRSLTRIALCGLPVSGGWVRFGAALRRNNLHSLQILDLSNNRIDLDGISSLARAFQSFPHALLELNLSNCSLPSKGITVLFKSFCCNFGASLALECLNLSHNAFDELSTQGLAEWLGHIQNHSKLRVLRLANTGVQMALVAKYFRYFPSLRILDLADNKLDSTDCHLLSTSLDTSVSINSLSIARCVSKSEFTISLFQSITSNKALSSLKIDFGKNKLDEKDIPAFCQALSLGVNRLHTLDLTAVKFREKDLSSVLSALGPPPQSSSFSPLTSSTLECLILDYCFSEKNPSGADEFGFALSMFLDACPTIRALSLRGFGHRVLQPLLVVLARNSTLRELRISDNDMKDGGASLLSTALRYNSTLYFLECDDNCISINGWQAIEHAFSFNTSLCQFAYPWEDYARCLARLPSSKHEKLREILGKIQFHVTRNSLNAKEPIDFLFSVKPKTFEIPEIPTSIAPLATVPEFLAEIQRNNCLMDVAIQQGFDDEEDLVWQGSLKNETKKKEPLVHNDSSLTEFNVEATDRGDGEEEEDDGEWEAGEICGDASDEEEASAVQGADGGDAGVGFENAAAAEMKAEIVSSPSNQRPSRKSIYFLKSVGGAEAPPPQGFEIIIDYLC